MPSADMSVVRGGVQGVEPVTTGQAVTAAMGVGRGVDVDTFGSGSTFYPPL